MNALIEPNLQQFLTEAKTYNTIPMSTTIVADTKTPIQLFQLFGENAAFLLESNDYLSPWANYSFIGIQPNHFFIEKEGKFCLINQAGDLVLENESLQNGWDESLRYFNVSPTWPNVPFPGGAVGYFSFEAYGLHEPTIHWEKKQVPDVYLAFCETILAFHHEKEELMIIHLQSVDGDDQVGSYEKGRGKIISLLTAIQNGDTKQDSTILPSNEQLTEDLFYGVGMNYQKDKFLQDVNEIKERIQANEVFQVVLSQRFHCEVQSSGFDLYRVLRKVNPSPYLYYLRLGELELIGSSPERQVKIDEARMMEIHPIAGTRPRGKTKEEDEALKDELLADKKELAEHEMLVDLAIEDMTKVSEQDSIFIQEPMSVVYFSHVMHLITKVYGKLKDSFHPFEALLAAHPAGTVSGAPKARAVEVIQQLEGEPRGVYAGAIAYCGFNNAVDSCIAIRTILLKNGVATVQAGAGIVKESDPEKEYEETKNKARGLLYAIKLAEARLNAKEVLK